jgi:hypothetical protein
VIASIPVRGILVMVTLLGAGCGRLGFPRTGGDDGPGDSSVDAAPRLVTSIDIITTANVWGAGHPVPPSVDGSPGTLPDAIALPAGTGRVLTVSEVAGVIVFGPGIDPNDADGILGGNGDGSYGGLAAPMLSGRRFLAAVLLDASEPVDPAPPALAMDRTAPMFAPGVAQIFFVGDGLTGAGTGEIQRFAVPDAATRLFFGFLDGDVGLMGPGSYDDNIGNVTGSVTIY